MVPKSGGRKRQSPRKPRGSRAKPAQKPPAAIRLQNTVSLLRERKIKPDFVRPVRLGAKGAEKEILMSGFYDPKTKRLTVIAGEPIGFRHRHNADMQDRGTGGRMGTLQIDVHTLEGGRHGLIYREVPERFRGMRIGTALFALARVLARRAGLSSISAYASKLPEAEATYRKFPGKVSALEGGVFGGRHAQYYEELVRTKPGLEELPRILDSRAKGKAP